MARVLFLSKNVEDTSWIVDELVRHNFSCTRVYDVGFVLQQIDLRMPDIFLIEVKNVQEDERLCRYLREKKNLPVLAITSSETAVNLDGTVDDFVLSPFNIAELITRMKRLINKRSRTFNPETIVAGSLIIDTAKYEVHINGSPIPLTFREYELLKFFASNPGRVFSRDSLLNGVWGEDFFGGDRTVDVHVRRLRSKIENEKNSYIETVRNIGYRFVKKN